MIVSVLKSQAGETILVDGGWTTHDWVRHELTVAREAGKPAIGVIESGVSTAGPYGDHERIDLDRDTLAVRYAWTKGRCAVRDGELVLRLGL